MRPPAAASSPFDPETSEGGTWRHCLPVVGQREPRPAAMARIGAKKTIAKALPKAGAHRRVTNALASKGIDADSGAAAARRQSAGRSKATKLSQAIIKPCFRGLTASERTTVKADGIYCREHARKAMGQVRGRVKGRVGCTAYRDIAKQFCGHDSVFKRVSCATKGLAARDEFLTAVATC